MAGSPNHVTVDVILKPGQTPPFEFQSSDLPVGSDNSLTFANNGRPGFLIDYSLKEPTHGYRFPDNSIPDNLNEALYSAEGPGCPNAKGQWQQFKAQNVKQQGKILVVRNLNECAAEFGYTLRVTDDQGASYLPLDPGGFNQNGPQVKSSWPYAAAAVGGAVAGSLLTLGAQALLQG